MKRPRMAFVVTFSIASSIGLTACEKKGAGGECKPPDCHMNPPPRDLEPAKDAGAVTPTSSAK